MDERGQHRGARPGGGKRAGRSGGGETGVPGFDPQRLWQILRRRRFYIILSFLVIGVVLAMGVQTITPVYTAASRIQLEERSTGTHVDAMMTQEARRVRDQENLVMVRETVNSRELLVRLIRNLNLRDDPDVMARARMLQQEQLPDRTAAVIAERILIARLRNKIRVGSRGGNLFIIAVEDNNPHTCFKLTQALTQGFIDEMSQRRVEGLIDSAGFTDEQLEEAQSDLQDAEQNLEIFKRTRLINEELSGNPVNAENSKRAEILLRTLRLDIEENERELTTLDARIRASLPQLPERSVIESNPIAQNLRERLANLEREDYLVQLNSGSETGPRSSGGISAERQRIGIQRNRLTEHIVEVVEERYPQETASVRTNLVRYFELLILDVVLREHEDRAAREYTVYQSQVKEQPALEADLRRLEVDVKTKEDVYNQLINAQISGEFRRAANESGFGSSVRVLEPAKKPLFPTKPNKTKIIILGVVLALGIGLGAVFLAEYVDTSFKDVGDIEHHLGMEVLGTLPRFADEFQWEKSKRRTIYMWRTAFVLTLVTIMVLFVLYYRRSTVQDRINLSGSETSTAQALPGEDR